MFVSDRRLYLNADRSRIVEESDPQATFLLCGVGGQLDDATADKYGLIESLVMLASSASDVTASGADLSVDKAERKAEELPEHKAVEPAENKAIFPAANNQTRRVTRRER